MSGTTKNKNGADGGTRTPKPVRALDPEPSVFTNFTTSASILYIHLLPRVCQAFSSVIEKSFYSEHVNRHSEAKNLLE